MCRQLKCSALVRLHLLLFLFFVLSAVGRQRASGLRWARSGTSREKRQWAADGAAPLLLLPEQFCFGVYFIFHAFVYFKEKKYFMLMMQIG